MKTDAQLATDVLEELRWDPTVCMESVQVSANNGIVTLSGTVPHFADKWAAERATQRVQGVKGIAEEIDVNRRARHNHKDADIAAAVANVLKWHVWVPDTIQATVENGQVTLNGSVEWEFERNSARDAVAYLAGVTKVVNNVTIRPGVQPTAVKEAIEKALRRDAEIDAGNIKVSAHGGKVTLTGNTHSWNERKGAGWAAWSAPGVTEVQNNLSVSI